MEFKPYNNQFNIQKSVYKFIQREKEKHIHIPLYLSDGKKTHDYNIDSFDLTTLKVKTVNSSIQVIVPINDDCEAPTPTNTPTKNARVVYIDVGDKYCDMV